MTVLFFCRPKAGYGLGWDGVGYRVFEYPFQDSGFQARPGETVQVPDTAKSSVVSQATAERVVRRVLGRGVESFFDGAVPQSSEDANPVLDAVSAARPPEDVMAVLRAAPQMPPQVVRGVVSDDEAVDYALAEIQAEPPDPDGSPDVMHPGVADMVRQADVVGAPVPPGGGSDEVDGGVAAGGPGVGAGGGDDVGDGGGTCPDVPGGVVVGGTGGIDDSVHDLPLDSPAGPGDAGRARVAPCSTRVRERKRRDIDADVFIFIRYGGFVLATVVSALFNIFLFTSLDRSYVWLLLCFSIALEGTKVSSVVGAHIFRDLYHKTRLRRLLYLSGAWFVVYFALAAFSILASLGFSLTVTARTRGAQDADIAQVERHKEAVEAQMAKMDDLRAVSSLSVQEYAPYVEADSRYKAAVDVYNVYNAAYAKAEAEAQTVPKDSEGYDQARARSGAAWTERRAALQARDTALAERDAVQRDFLQRKARSDELMDEAASEMQVLLSQAGVDAESGAVACLQLEARVQEMRAAQVKEQGMGWMFVQFAEYTGLSEAQVKIIILMFASVLLELTIFSSSPDIRLSRRILRFFVSVLPSDIDIDALLESIDADNSRLR